MLNRKLFILLIDRLAALQSVRGIRGDKDQVLFLNAGLVHLSVDLQDRSQTGSLDLGQFFGVGGERIQAVLAVATNPMVTATKITAGIANLTMSLRLLRKRVVF